MIVNLEDLQPRKLMVATPRGGSLSMGSFNDSYDDVRMVIDLYGLHMQRCRVDNDSSVGRARNTLADEFMRSECTHLLFWDGDVGATPDDVFTLLNLADPKSDKDVVCGLYPKKHICWDKIEAAVLQGVPADQLENYVGDFVFNPVGLKGEYSLYEPLDVRECGTGFMMIQRHVFEKFLEHYDREYVTDHHGDSLTGCFFIDEIDPISRRYLTEDYNFCRLIRLIGLQVWVVPWLNLTHTGNYKFIGNPAAVSSLVQPSTAAA